VLRDVFLSFTFRISQREKEGGAFPEKHHLPFIYRPYSSVFINFMIFCVSNFIMSAPYVYASVLPAHALPCILEQPCTNQVALSTASTSSDAQAGRGMAELGIKEF